MFLAAMFAGIVVLAGRGSPTVPSSLLCSVDDISVGIRNWMEHEGCDHTLIERFQRRCLVMYWSHGLD